VEQPGFLNKNLKSIKKYSQQWKPPEQSNNENENRAKVSRSGASSAALASQEFQHYQQVLSAGVKSGQRCTALHHRRETLPETFRISLRTRPFKMWLRSTQIQKVVPASWLQVPWRKSEYSIECLLDDAHGFFDEVNLLTEEYTTTTDIFSQD
jgi:hypothetical protein